MTRVRKRGRWTRWSQRGGKGLGTGFEGRGLASHPLSLSKCNMKALRVLSSGLTQLCGTRRVSLSMKVKEAGVELALHKGFSPLVFLLLVPLTTHNSGQSALSGPFSKKKLGLSGSQVHPLHEVTH